MGKNYEKVLEDAKRDLQKFVDKGAWSESNVKSGYLDGIEAYKFHLDNMDERGRMDRWKRTQFEYEFSVEYGNYGLAANLAAWSSGWGSAETACRLDELEAMGLK